MSPILSVCAENPPQNWSKDITSAAVGNHESFEELKKRISFLVMENKDLEAQYKALYQEFSGLKARLDEIVEAEAVQNFPDPFEDDATFEIDPAIANLSPAQIQNEILVKKSRISYFSGQLLDAKDKERLWQLQLANLENQKRELNIEGNVKQLSSEEIEDKKKKELDKIQQAIDRSIQQEQVIYHQIQEFQNRSENSSKTKEQLSQENAALETKIISLERRAALNLKENAILKKKKLLAQKINASDTDEKRQSYRALQDEVALLEEEYARMDETVGLSLEQQERQRELIRSVIDIDKQNQQLRERINALQQKMAASQ